MKIFRLVVMLAMFVPGFALLGAFAAYDDRERTPWIGMGVGAIGGAFFGLVFGGVRGEWLDAILGPDDEDGERSDA